MCFLVANSGARRSAVGRADEIVILPRALHSIPRRADHDHVVKAAPVARVDEAARIPQPASQLVRDGSTSAG